MNNPEGTKKFLSGLKPEAVPTKPVPFLSVIATTNLDALDSKKTSDCFPKSRYVYRDGDLDNWLPTNQPKADACVVTTLAISQDWTFAEAAAKVLGVGAGSGVKFLGEALIANGHTMKSLAQVEEMVEATERGDKTMMRTDGYGNFAFVETGDPENPVSVGNVFRGGRGWDARVGRLGRDDRWDADNRLLVRNLDASKL